MQGELCYGSLPVGSIKALKGIAGIDVFSLQGRKILCQMFNGAGNREIVNGVLKNIPSQIYYVKYIPGVIGKTN